MTQSAILRRASALAAGTATLLLLHAPVIGQEGGAADGANTVQGVVTQDDGTTPITGAVVSVPAENAGTLTDREGRFTLENLPDGEHTLRVQATGYGRQSQTISLPGQAGQELAFALETSAFQLGEVVATATPLARGRAYQPARSYSEEELGRRLSTSFGEMLDREPGVAMRSFGSAPGRPIIRGLDGDRIVMLEDGERMGDISETAADHSIAMDPLVAERVEVVRGPASLLYGSSALGGVVNLRTRDIPRDWTPGVSGGLSAQGATVNQMGSGLARAQFGGERFAATGRISYRGNTDVQTPGGILPGTYGQNLTGAGGIGFRTDRFDGGVSLSYLDQTFGLPDEIDDPDEDVEIRLDRQRVLGEANWRPDALFNDIEFRVMGARFFQQEVEMELEPDGSIDEDIEHEFTRFTGGSTIIARHGEIGPIEEGALGFNVLLQTLAASGEDEFTPDGQAFSIAGFFFEQFALTETLRLQAGARAEANRTEASPNEIFPTFEAERSFNNISGSIGLNLRPSEVFEFGLQVARAHRAPLIEELYSNGPHLGTGQFEIGDPDLLNEVSHGLDIFGRFGGQNFLFELAGFYNQIENFIILAPTGQTDEDSELPIFEYEADRAALTGGEASLQALVTPRLNVRTTLDYVFGTRLDDTRTPLPFMPPLRGLVEGTYEVGDGWIGASVRPVAAQNRVPGPPQGPTGDDDVNPGQQPTGGYTLLGFQAGYSFVGNGQHTVLLRVDNALDTMYRDHLSHVNERQFPMPGRNLNLVYRYSF